MRQPDQDRPTFKLVLRGESGEWLAPVEVRLRRALKALLRVFGLRAVSVEQVPPAPPAEDRR